MLTQNTLATDSSGMIVGHRYRTVSTSNDKVLYDAVSPKEATVDIMMNDYQNSSQYNVPIKKNTPSGTTSINLKPMR